MSKWFRNSTRSNGLGNQTHVCRYCGRSSNEIALKRSGDYGQYYSCVDSESCLACQEYITIRAELEAKERADKAAKKEREKPIIRQEFYDRNSDLIDKFLQIAERKVSIIDDYGDENAEALRKEAQTFAAF